MIEDTNDAAATPTPPPGDAADLAALVARAQAHDSQAFALLYERSVDAVHRYMLFRVRDPQLARDLTQDVFEAMLRGLGSLESPERFVGWLFSIAHHRVVSHWRRERRRQADTDVTVDLPADDDVDAIERSVDAAGLMAAAKSLNQAQQDVLALRFVTGLSVRDAALALGRSEDALKKLQRRALAKLRQRIVAPGAEVDA